MTKRQKLIFNQLHADFQMTIDALRTLAIRFPVEHKTKIKPKKSCKCLQFEDNRDCRHTNALEVLDLVDGK